MQYRQGEGVYSALFLDGYFHTESVETQAKTRDLVRTLVTS